MLHHVTQLHEPLSAPVLTTATTATTNKQQYDQESQSMQSINTSSSSQNQKNEKNLQMHLFEEETPLKQYKHRLQKIVEEDKALPPTSAMPLSSRHRKKNFFSSLLDQDGDPSTAFWFGMFLFILITFILTGISIIFFVNRPENVVGNYYIKQYCPPSASLPCPIGQKLCINYVGFCLRYVCVSNSFRQNTC
ncbi:696_t:CDS:2 [Entrophospora sp. SA101]|nr:1973_t:CDS:2 [Entrophospora sp. SA101]CAJ0639254.1 10267_t:CDS:2 [Entrophospora sp. SA101]CAJ0749536.1 11135_t:CDS:2 [Entrophospora sp. SA101]CAJ0755159.1 696_t:CDS:2 [Entrophospora sp. SA101]CAJ0842633.1 10089_t:CDS:2 [Entrophospora sp. SA101]